MSYAHTQMQRITHTYTYTYYSKSNQKSTTIFKFYIHTYIHTALFFTVITLSMRGLEILLRGLLVFGSVDFHACLKD